MTRYYDSFFIVASERDGFRHLYKYSNAGSLMKQVTKGDWEVTDFYGYDPATMRYYYQSTQTGALNRVVASVDAKGVSTILSPKEGTSSAQFNASFTYYVQNFSDVNTPDTYSLFTSKGKEVREIEANREYADRFRNVPEKTFFTMTSAGETLNGYMIKPARLQRVAEISGYHVPVQRTVFAGS